MGLVLQYNDGETPLDEDEKEGLRISFITTRDELNEVEQRNIEQAIRWTMQRRRRFSINELLTEHFVKELHKKMFGDVWQWAGTFRNSNKNIGVDKFQISTALKSLLDDCRYWLDNGVYEADEIAIRFKHRIVNIHCFANGNGRHSRLIADIMIENLFDKEVFSWGAGLTDNDDPRKLYLTAVRAADKGVYELLLEFARS